MKNSLNFLYNLFTSYSKQQSLNFLESKKFEIFLSNNGILHYSYFLKIYVVH